MARITHGKNVLLRSTGLTCRTIMDVVTHIAPARLWSKHEEKITNLSTEKIRCARDYAKEVRNRRGMVVTKLRIHNLPIDSVARSEPKQPWLSSNLLNTHGLTTTKITTTLPAQRKIKNETQNTKTR